MKILLLGEFSGFYLNLKSGLEWLGHDVVIAAAGDGFKRIPADIDFGSRAPVGLDKALRRIYPWLKLKYFEGYDVVQVVNPFLFFKSGAIGKAFFNFILRNNERVYLSAAGCDAFFWQHARNRLRYGPFDDFLKYDLRSTSFYLESARSMEFNKWLVEKVAGVIPVMYEYEVAYEDCGNRLPTIPLPLNIDEVKYKDNVCGEKLIVFHGLNRYGFKGTRHVEAAFEYLKNRYPSDLELIIDGRMPLKKYLEVMSKTNVVVDQVYSYSLGVNGLYALAQGKVVVGGAEPESLCSLGVAETPVINITPEPKSIIRAIEYVLDNRHNLVDLGLKSRRFVEEVHCHRKIAKRYVDVWRGNI